MGIFTLCHCNWGLCNLSLVFTKDIAKSQERPCPGFSSNVEIAEILGNTLVYLGCAQDVVSCWAEL